MAQVARERSDIPKQYTWDTDSIYATVEDWETAVSALKTDLDAITQYKGRLHENAATLADYLEQATELQSRLRRVFVFASLNYSVETHNQELAGRFDKARSIFGYAQAALSFGEPEMLGIGFDTIFAWVAADERLAVYQHYFERLQKREAHVRSAEVEQVLGMAQDTIGTASATHSVLANADLKFEPATDANGETYDITQGTIGGLLNAHRS